MTEQEVLEGRKNYYNLLKLREKILGAKEVIETLEQNPEVQQYKQMLEKFYYFNDEEFKTRLNEKIYYETLKTKRRYLNVAFNPITSKTEHSNKIYVLMGKHIITDKGYIEPATPNDVGKNYLTPLYELETGEFIWGRKQTAFIMEHHTVICVPGVDQYRSFDDFRADFLEQLLDNPQEEVVQKILSKYRYEAK